jgi:hypothetical protein
MIGISADNLMWVSHFLFPISRAKPRVNLRRLIVKNIFPEEIGIVVEPRRVSFTKRFPFHYYTVFVKHEMGEGVTKLNVLFNVFCFLYLSVGMFFLVNQNLTNIIPLIV